jgi:hypothetical protein
MRLLAIPLLVACTADVPDSPSFQLHVMPILAAHCVRCHGDPPIGGAPSEFRLDVYGDVVVREGRPREPDFDGQCGFEPADAEAVVCGAATYAQTIALRVGGDSNPMPPRFPIEDHQVETLRRWADTAERGAPRAQNHVPTVVVVDAAQTGAALALRIRTADDDHDLVVGELRATVGGVPRLVGVVRNGVVDLVWDTTGIAPGTYPIVAHLDDGAMVHQVAAGQVVIGGS